MTRKYAGYDQKYMPGQAYNITGQLVSTALETIPPNADDEKAAAAAIYIAHGASDVLAILGLDQENP